MPDLVGHGASTRATFYRETFDLPGSSKEQGKEHRLYLALYQTNFEEPLKSKEYLGIRTTSEILPGKQIMGAGEFNARNYELIQDYDPDSIGEGILGIKTLHHTDSHSNFRMQCHRTPSLRSKWNRWTKLTLKPGIGKSTLMRCIRFQAIVDRKGTSWALQCRSSHRATLRDTSQFMNWTT